MEKYEISQEAYEQRQGTGCPAMDGGLGGLEEVWGQAEVCAGAHRIDRDTEGKLPFLSCTAHVARHGMIT